MSASDEFLKIVKNSDVSGGMIVLNEIGKRMN